MNVNEFLQKYRVVKDGMTKMRPRVQCKDGYTVSVQAGYGYYSRPRDDADAYTAVELGYPSEIDPELMPYYDGSICAYVPVEIVDRLFAKHGGIVGAYPSNNCVKMWKEDGK